MIIIRTAVLDGKEVHYEAVLRDELVMSGEVAKYQIVVHDPEYSGGRRHAALLPEGVPLPEGHVILGALAVK